MSLDKAHRPVTDEIIGPDSRLRDPAVQIEVELRVPIYAEQVAQHGHIRRWLPRRGKGKSARAMRVEQSVQSACAAAPAEECERVLGDDE
jgi:hypothetical protein